MDSDFAVILIGYPSYECGGEPDECEENPILTIAETN